MAKLPADVERLRQKLSKQREIRERFGEAACKLLDDSPELVSMWRAIERRSEKSDPWVDIFLGFVKDASQLPPFHYISVKERLKLSDRIQRLSDELTELLDENDLDEHLIFLNGKIFHGFYSYEDFGESNRARFDQTGEPKLKISDVIRKSAGRSLKLIREEPVRGKAGRNVRSIRLARVLAAQMRRHYGQHLLLVVAVAANTIFDTNYTEGDIQNLLSR